MTLDFQGRVHVEGTASPFEKVQEPNPLLGKAQRRSVAFGPPERVDPLQLGVGCFPTGHQRYQISQTRRGEQLLQGQLHAETRAGPG